MNITEEQKKKLLELYDVDPYDEWAEGKQKGIEDVLDVLGIEIEGINKREGIIDMFRGEEKRRVKKGTIAWWMYLEQGFVENE